MEGLFVVLFGMAFGPWIVSIAWAVFGRWLFTRGFRRFEPFVIPFVLLPLASRYLKGQYFADPLRPLNVISQHAEYLSAISLALLVGAWFVAHFIHSSLKEPEDKR